MSGVTAAPEVQHRLLDLQAIDDERVRIAAHRRRLTAAADLAALTAEHTALRRTAADRRDAHDDLRSRIGRLEVDVRLVEQRLERDRTRLHASSSTRDVQGLEQEIASLQRRRTALEDDELELMEAAEQAEAELAEAQRQVTEVDDRLGVMRRDRDDALTGLEQQQRDAEGRRSALVADLPGDLVALYDRQRTRYGIGAARLVGAVSQGSNVELTGADLARVRAAPPDAVVLDPESSCILVRSDA